MRWAGEHLQRGVLVLVASRAVRAFAFSCLSIVFAIYLNQLGFSTVTVGLLLSAGFLQFFHKCAFYFIFRDIKPPEEQPAVLGAASRA